MRKIWLPILCCLFILFGCGKDNVIPKLYPTDLLNAEDIAEIIENKYSVTLKSGAVIEKDNVLTAKYLSDPIGSGDSICIEVTYPDENHNAESVHEKFKKSADKRTDRITIKGLSDEAYIAYPTLHMLHRGYYISVTAGSGGGDSQSALLVEMGKRIMSNFEEYIEKYLS